MKLPTALRLRWADMLFTATIRGAGIFVVTLAVMLLAVLLLDAYPALRHAGEYRIFTSMEWIPKPTAAVNQAKPSPTFGALAFIYGTIITSALAMLIAVPLGVGSATFLAEVAGPRVRRVGMALIELLSAIPSVVYGLWGLFVLAPLLQKVFTFLGGPNTGGNGILAASIILAIMIVPYITAITFQVCRAVPLSQREGALALGSSKWLTIYSIVWPYARPGIIAASFLALGRALGETMAVTMLIGNQATMDFSPFALGDTIAARIANQLHEADEPDFRASLVALALVLFVVTGVFNVLARQLLKRLVRGPRPAPESVSDIAPVVQTMAEPPAAWKLPVASNIHRLRFWNRAMLGLLALCFTITVVPLFLILSTITIRGIGAMELNLFTERGRSALPNAVYEQYRSAKANGTALPLDDLDRPVKRGGLGHAMLGSLMIVGLATLGAVPVGFLAAVYLAESHSSRFANTLRFIAELLGGVPSIVIGIFAYAVLVYPVWLGGVAWGYSGVAGAFALGVMMVPIIIRSTEEAMKLVPDSLRQASYALGASRMQTILGVVVPASLPAIFTGIFLAIGRIAGETAPLLLTAGNIDRWPSTAASPTPFLPYYIFTYSRGAYHDQRDQAWAATLVLLVFIMTLNVGIRLLARRSRTATGE